jgi:lysophospholipase L1-like esterase
MIMNAKYYLIGAGVGLLGLGLLLVFTRSKDKKPKAEEKVLKNILFIGDSMTSETWNGQPTYTYSYLIKHKLTDKNVDIIAEVGKTTSWMLSNLKTKLAAKKYDRVYIWGGINDIFSGYSQVNAISNIQSMVDLVVAQGGDAYVLIGYTTEKFMTPAVLTASKYNAAMKPYYVTYQKKLKSSIKHATIVDEFDLSSAYSSDGIHPTVAAHQLIANELMKGMK